MWYQYITLLHICAVYKMYGISIRWKVSKYNTVEERERVNIFIILTLVQYLMGGEGKKEKWKSVWCFYYLFSMKSKSTRGKTLNQNQNQSQECIVYGILFVILYIPGSRELEAGSTHDIDHTSLELLLYKVHKPQ